jgi:GntR family transcriptional repressor for pyruvate dehydrogenase complex
MDMIKRTSTSEAIVEHLLTQIRKGEYGPGDWLPSERQLQEQLGVGRLALREALARLSALGIIQVSHGKGAQLQEQVDEAVLINALIPSFAGRSSKGLQDLVETRSLIEGELAAKAALKRTDEDIERLRRILDDPGTALTSDEALAEMDFSFHCEVARIADNEFLTVMMKVFADHVRSFLLNYVRAYQDAESIIKRHRPILEAIIAGDPERARRYAHNHVQICKSTLENLEGLE